MSRPIQIKNHPFRFLLYLEWVLLGMAILGALEPSRPGRHLSNQFPDQFPELTIFSLILFGLMGLRLPTGKQVNKVAYTACEVCLILITILFGGRASRLFPFIYLILMTRSCLIFQLPGRIVVTVLSFTLFLLTTFIKFQRFSLPPGGQERFRFFTFSFVILFGLALVFVLLLMNTMVSERQGREKLAAANEKLREYALKIENQATLEERNRIAREIHDSLGHSLTVLNLQLETALKLWQTRCTAFGFGNAIASSRRTIIR
jgi:signal transduction histidine kinase